MHKPLIRIPFLLCVIASLRFLLFTNLVEGQSLTLNRFDVYQQQAVVERDSMYLGFQSAIKYAPNDQEEYFTLLPIYTHSTYNSTYAAGFNDGAHWQGAGFNQALSFGFQGRKGRFEYTLAPLFSYSQNLEYDYGLGQSELLINRPEFLDQFTRNIDYVKRYGDRARTVIHPGQSEVAYTLNKVRLSFGTSNQWWGPGVYQAGLLSNHSPGILHFRAESTKPLHTFLGDFGFQFMSGQQMESDYFNSDASDDRRIFNGAVITYKPIFFKGMTMSINRVMQLMNKDSESVTDYAMLLTDFFRRSQENQDRTVSEAKNQVISLAFDWRSKEDDFRVYVEWIREDWATNVVSLFELPDWGSAFFWGFNKKFNPNFIKNGFFLLSFEQWKLTTWEPYRTIFDIPFSLPYVTSFLYAHTPIEQGLTQNGQILGSSFGPGSSGHVINLSWVQKNQKVGIEYYRRRSNDDYYFLRNNSKTYNEMHHYFAAFVQKDWNKLTVFSQFAFGIQDNFRRANFVYHNWQGQVILRYRL